MGHDFSRVRIHADQHAALMANRYAARAFTLGENVYFGESEYRPSMQEGRHLLVHELAHVRQFHDGLPLAVLRAPKDDELTLVRVSCESNTITFVRASGHEDTYDLVGGPDCQIGSVFYRAKISIDDEGRVSFELPSAAVADVDFRFEWREDQTDPRELLPTDAEVSVLVEGESKGGTSTSFSVLELSAEEFQLRTGIAPERFDEGLLTWLANEEPAREVPEPPGSDAASAVGDALKNLPAGPGSSTGPSRSLLGIIKKSGRIFVLYDLLAIGMRAEEAARTNPATFGRVASEETFGWLSGTLGGAIAGALFCSSGAGTLACIAGGVLGGGVLSYAGSEGGEWLGGELYDALVGKPPPSAAPRLPPSAAPRTPRPPTSRPLRPPAPSAPTPIPHSEVVATEATTTSTLPQDSTEEVAATTVHVPACELPATRQRIEAAYMEPAVITFRGAAASPCQLDLAIVQPPTLAKVHLGPDSITFEPTVDFYLAGGPGPIDEFVYSARASDGNSVEVYVDVMPKLAERGHSRSAAERRRRRRERRQLRRTARRGQRARAAETASGTRDEVATLELRTHTETVDPTRARLAEILDGLVGHTWIRIEVDDPVDPGVSVGEPTVSLFAREGETQLGFWPLMTPDNDEFFEDVRQRMVERAALGQTRGEGGSFLHGAGYSTRLGRSWVQGRVEEPDDSHDDYITAQKRYRISAAELENALRYANSKRDADYSLSWYNCTTFALDMLRAAGQTAPSSGGLELLGIKLPNGVTRILDRWRRGGDADIDFDEQQSRSGESP